MTQRSRPQAENITTNPLYIDSGPYTADQWRERVYAAHTGDENTTGERTKLRGVIPTFDNMLVVSEPVAGTIRVGTGAGVVYGSYLFNSATVDFDALGDAPAANPRIDLVCMVENNTNAPVSDGTAANGWIFPTDLTDYNALSSIPAYSARLVIVKGAEAGAPVEPTLDTSNSLYMVAIAKYQISVLGVVSAFVDRREFADIEKIVGVESADNTTVKDALILGTEVNNDFGDDGLGTGILVRLEDDAGDIEDASRLSVLWKDSTDAAEDAQFKIDLMSQGTLNTSVSIVAPSVISPAGNGNARGYSSVDMQQFRSNVANVASGDYSTISGGASNRASGTGSTVAGGVANAASGTNSMAACSGTTASGDYSSSEGNGSTASGESAHAEGNGTTASGDYSHAEGTATTASGSASHAEGSGTASSAYAHAEGFLTTASTNISAHAEGSTTTASGYASHAGGYEATATKFNQFARGGGKFATAGDGQYSDYHAHRSVTHSDANWYELFLNGVDQRITVATDQVMTFDALIVGTTQGCTKSFSFRIVGIVENDGGTTSLLASTVTTIYDADDVSFDARATGDDANDALLIELQDSDGAGDTVRWSCVVRCAEVTFPA